MAGEAGITVLPYDLATGVVAEVGKGEKQIALRADIDALPIEERSGVAFTSPTSWRDACLRP
ncbi:amidohydrolase [Leclercia adecarboxylata]|uniref:Amidohydrolase n=1 Tax=Leclercia adecarboxylata TaxID=83655 RepID=A0A4U9HV25_9ENTR|nr:amidohydrolase [Leclercia adecarboxylata]